ncbi:MAG: putative sulfate exporter family transporter, partial [Xanthobacteraceae bacterium]
LAAFVAILARLLDDGGFGSSLLFALLLGMLARPLAESPDAVAGVDFASAHLLAVAVALLGVRLTIGDVAAIGLWPAVVVAAAVAATLVFGIFAARFLGLSTNLGIIAGSGTAFCGASAAVAVAAVLPKRPGIERDTALVIAGVIGLSAIAMVVYPLLVVFLGFDDLHAGIFLGGSIHNVPQAVAAGMTVSESAGGTATLTKLFRISLLAPFVLTLAVAYGRREGASLTSIEIPWFVIAFAILLVLGSFGFVPAPLKSALLTASSWLMLAAIAAIGMHTSLEAMRTVGARVLVLLVLNSLVLAALLLAAALLGIV